jgi:hypothetical protein
MNLDDELNWQRWFASRTAAERAALLARLELFQQTGSFLRNIEVCARRIGDLTVRGRVEAVAGEGIAGLAQQPCVRLGRGDILRTAEPAGLGRLPSRHRVPGSTGIPNRTRL